MLRVTYIGHATLLIEIAKRRILTDPNFDEALGKFLPRVSIPGIALDALPKLDAILVTHAHADHLSFKSLDALPVDIPLFAPPAIAKWLGKRGYRHAVPIAAAEEVELDGVKIRAATATHRGNRYAVDRWRSAANMYLIDTNKVSCFFAGDTALASDTTHLVEKHLRANARNLDLALLPIGYAPWWKPGFRKGHLTSTDALTLFERLKARYFIPYHWGTFNHVTSTAFDAIDRLRATLQDHPLHPAVKILEPGTTFVLPTAGA
ncbi:MAG TPA: MBL fold metallo-hydrolase [Gemmatimonadaceae bacterium]|jgi:L-ascorbate metabolism protein UlaG (beta-lactamase superfamily)|nr:MBL fold metallo-hydrolase [Gemmatimonadaceae bacterium]